MTATAAVTQSVATTLPCSLAAWSPLLGKTIDAKVLLSPARQIAFISSVYICSRQLII